MSGLYCFINEDMCLDDVLRIVVCELSLKKHKYSATLKPLLLYNQVCWFVELGKVEFKKYIYILKRILIQLVHVISSFIYYSFFIMQF